jgi:hypothetical protein
MKPSIPTLADKWAAINQQLLNDGYADTYVLESLFYQGVRTYLEMQKELRALGLTSPEMDRIVHNWEIEAHDAAF